MLHRVRKIQPAYELVIKLVIDFLLEVFYMKKFLLVMTILSVFLFIVITACDDPSSSGAYACWGGFSDTCWDADEDSESDCTAQGRTLSEGTCPDNGYPVDCGTYWVKSGVACW